jgi:hypothetical protein
MLRVCLSALEAATAAEVEAMKEAGSMKKSTEWAVATALHCNLLRMHGQQHENVVVTSASAATSLPTPATKLFGAFWWSAQAAVSLAPLKQHVRLCSSRIFLSFVHPTRQSLSGCRTSWSQHSNQSNAGLR